MTLLAAVELMLRDVRELANGGGIVILIALLALTPLAIRRVQKAGRPWTRITALVSLIVWAVIPLVWFARYALELPNPGLGRALGFGLTVLLVSWVLLLTSLLADLHRQRTSAPARPPIPV